MRHLSRSLVVISIGFAGAVSGACGSDASREKPDGSSAAPEGVSSRSVVDSALPIDTLLHRFRATLPDTPAALVGGESSPERLARALLGALSANDTSRLRTLVISRAEFAWLYYPHTHWTRPPYEMGPDLVWLQVSANSEKGLVRLVRRYGGSPLRFDGLSCSDSVLREGPNVIVQGCRVRFAAADSAARELQLFGSVLSRDGRHKFVSFANDL